MFEKEIIVDAHDHILGRLASTVAKELLNGQKVTVTRCEGLVVTGAFRRNLLKYVRFLVKRTATNPKQGPIHFRAPSRMLWRTIRGMLPHKTARGTEALKRLRVYEGVPPPYDRKKRLVIPGAHRVNRLRPERKFTRMARLSSEVGWKYGQVVERLEAKRKVRAEAYHLRKRALERLQAKAKATAEGALKEEAKTLAQFGF
eukprot:TRINITY_DN3809_c0_g1_i4.p2 TRINITY_DN3809_c0_g1~~TRINITY_DN3809_c0_g1_i4.p2  ORF type:complete len:201 (+),score=74.61 TRINITY_DN3809_c0_g1_i4:94-696(+)